MDKGQQSRYSKLEMEIIKANFKNEETCYYVRNVFYGFEKEIMGLSADALRIVKKTLIPELSPDIPLNQQMEIALTVKVNETTFPEMVLLQLEARKLVIDYLKERMAVLAGAIDNGMKLEDLRNKQGTVEERFISFMAYSFINSWIDGAIKQLYTLANLKEETEEEKKAKAVANSSK